MKDLNKLEVETLIEAMDCLDHDRGLEDFQFELRQRLYERKEEIEEMESMDLSDCAGGACKL